MWIGVVTALPELIEAGLGHGVIGRATSEGQIDIATYNVRRHASDNYGSIDDRPFGGAPGMLMTVEPLASCTDEALQSAPVEKPYKVLLSPQGERLTQELALELSAHDGLLLVCGRYEGVDERYVETYIDREISIGDYVISGGELPALVVIDAVGRLVEGALGNAKSVTDDSFSDNLLEGPQYTRPRLWRNKPVPPVLTSGNHAEIVRWRHEQALLRTWQRRPEMLAQRLFSAVEKEWLRRHVSEAFKGETRDG